MSRHREAASQPGQGWESFWQSLDSRLQRLNRKGRLRRLGTGHPPNTIDLSSNDYLGLRQDEPIQSMLRQSSKNLPFSSGGSRLLGGQHPIFDKLEDDFAAFKGAESSLYFPSGYSANEAICRAISSPDSCIFSDQLNHASIIDGLRLSKTHPKQRQVFPHNDMTALREMLSKSPYQQNFVITESLFSMDGDLAPVSELQSICREAGAILILDEAHALGVYGDRGQGLMDAGGIDPFQLITINPCGKGMGASGGFICGPKILREYLINTSREFIYSTAPSPHLAMGLIEIIKGMPKWDDRRRRLADISRDIHQHLKELSYLCSQEPSHIIPIILGDEARALKAEAFLAERNIICKAIRPPTVAAKSCRLRLSLHSALSEVQIKTIKDAFEELSYVI